MSERRGERRATALVFVSLNDTIAVCGAAVYCGTPDPDDPEVPRWSAPGGWGLGDVLCTGRLRPGVVETFRGWRRQGVEVHVVSSGSAPYLTGAVEAMGLHGEVDGVWPNGCEGKPRVGRGGVPWCLVDLVGVEGATVERKVRWLACVGGEGEEGGCVVARYGRRVVTLQGALDARRPDNGEWARGAVASKVAARLLELDGVLLEAAAGEVDIDVRDCWRCKGRGWVRIAPWSEDERRCDECDGRGEIWTYGDTLVRVPAHVIRKVEAR